MQIYGLQKMTVLDYPGHVACTIFTGGCDLRCPFCHNFELADGTAEPLMDETELLAFLRKRTGLLDGVAVTGGEPCLQKGLPSLLEKIKELGFLVKLDTNGLHPQMLGEMLNKQLVDYAAVDIKNAPEKYALTSGVREVRLEKLRESIGLLEKSEIDHEYRTTVVKEFHEENDFHGIGSLIRGAEKYFLQSFTDRDTVPFEGLHAPEKAELEKYRQIMLGYVKNAAIRGVD